MLNKPGAKPPTHLLATAAELRAGGASWTTVAKTVNRRQPTVKRWPELYPELWAAHLAVAERALVADAAAEGVHVLRRQLRSDDDKTSRDAAARLLDFKLAADKKAPPPDGKPKSRHHRIADLLEGMTDDQLQRLFDDLVRHWVADHSDLVRPAVLGGEDRPEPVPEPVSDRPAGEPADTGPGAPGAASLPEPAPEGGDRVAA
jgi:hypothetical protein